MLDLSALRAVVTKKATYDPAERSARTKKAWLSRRRAGDYSGPAEIAEYNAVERNIRHEPVEHAVIWAGGEKIWLTDGSRVSVQIPLTIDLTDGAITHNHPNSGCFSPDDIALTTMRNLRVMRATTRSGTWVLERPRGGDWPTGFLDQFHRQSNEVRQVFSRKISSGEMSRDDANTRHHAEVMARTVAKYASDVWGIKFYFEAGA